MEYSVSTLRVVASFHCYELGPRVLILHFSENGVVGVNFMLNRFSPDVFRKFSTCTPPPPPPPCQYPKK